MDKQKKNAILIGFAVLALVVAAYMIFFRGGGGAAPPANPELTDSSTEMAERLQQSQPKAPPSTEPPPVPGSGRLPQTPR
jgi:hypothetical protein